MWPGDEESHMRTNTLKLRRDGLVVNAEVRTEKLDEESLGSHPEVVARDAATGLRVEREQYDKATGDLLEEGHGYRWVNGEGDVVDDDDVRYYEVRDGGEREVERHDPTLGRGRTLSAVEWTPLSAIDAFLVTRTYEMWAEDEEDVDQLYELAEHVRASGEAPVLPVVVRPALLRSWGIVTPQFYDATFSLIVRVTRERVRPEHHMPIPGGETGEPGRTLEQESPFE